MSAVEKLEDAGVMPWEDAVENERWAEDGGSLLQPSVADTKDREESANELERADAASVVAGERVVPLLT